MRHIKLQPSKLTFIGLLVLLLSSCATNVGNSIKVSGEQIAKYDLISKPEAIASLGKRIVETRTANLPFLAPHYFREANELFTTVQDTPANTPKNIWVADISKAHTLLDKAESISLQVRERFPRELELKGLLDQFKASVSYPKEYAEIIENFSNLIEKVEFGKTDNIDKDKTALIKSMQVLDTKAVQYSTLHESDLVIQATQHKLDPKLAPIVLENALNIYADATKRIAAAAHNTEQVNRAGEEALFAAHRAWFITDRIIALQKLTLENIALEEEKQLSDISTATGLKDLRDQAIFKQVQIIASVAKSAIQDQTKLSVAQSSTQSLEKHLKESDALIQQCNILATSLTNQLAEKDAQIKTLSDKQISTETRTTP